MPRFAIYSLKKLSDAALKSMRVRPRRHKDFLMTPRTRPHWILHRKQDRKKRGWRRSLWNHCFSSRYRPLRFLEHAIVVQTIWLDTRIRATIRAESTETGGRDAGLHQNLRDTATL